MGKALKNTGSYISQNATSWHLSFYCLSNLTPGCFYKLMTDKMTGSGRVHSHGVDVSVPAAIAAWFPFLIPSLLSCCLPLRLLFLPSSLLQVSRLLLPDSPLHLLQSLTGANPLWAADLRPVQPLRAETNSRDVKSDGVLMLLWCFQLTVTSATSSSAQDSTDHHINAVEHPIRS